MTNLWFSYPVWIAVDNLGLSEVAPKGAKEAVRSVPRLPSLLGVGFSHCVGH